MPKVVYYQKHFKVLKLGHADFIVVRKHDVNYSQHSHLKTLQGAIHLIRLLEKGLLPNSVYLRESARRILKETEYHRLRQVSC